MGVCPISPAHNIYDLHCHSTFSDGSLSPEELLQRAADKGVNTLALTDHDTFAGYARAERQATALGLHMVTGIELSTQWAGRGIHVVGLNIDLQSAVMCEVVQLQERAREERAVAIAERLSKAGVAAALEGARRYAGEGAIGRPHFARYLVESGVVANMSQAFKRYLGAGKVGDVKNRWPEMAQAVEWIRQGGGVPVLAHPAKYKMTRTKLCVLTEQFKEAGGLAIEVISGKQPVGLAENLARIAHQFGLAGSCGSDFHAPGQIWQELGRFDPMPSSIPAVWELW
ncbi:hypothetical protein SAMN02745866_04112 [Alteromonadaceae bacterium Bs31]|nr:hypothetical protein SAMN02745866_04112 [Alteromonadaceae bacterium Bs31]